jgi:hypothetical protein
MSQDLILTPPEPKLSMSPMEMIQTAFNKAIEQGGALEVVDRILEQQKWMIRHNEEEAFNNALKRIQMNLKKIPKRGWNQQTNSAYATAEDVDDAIQHLLDQEQMTLSFKPAPSDKAEMVLIVGTLSLGAYSREYPLEMPADGKGAKGGGVMTRTHATGSAITYGKRYLKNMIFDLRFKEKDDDGNGAAAGASESYMDERDAADYIASIEGSGSVDELQKNYFKARDAAKEVGDGDAATKFADAKNRMYRKLSGGRR